MRTHTPHARVRIWSMDGERERVETGAAGLDGERCGVMVALRECSRLIGVAQPLASAWLQAIPGPSQFRLRAARRCT